MLKQLLIIFSLMMLLCNYSFSQCNYSLPDSICPGQQLTISQSGNITVDQCSSRLDSLIGIENLPALLGGGTYQFKMIKENGKYFIVTNVFGSVNTRRYEFNSTYDVLLNTSNIIANNDSCSKSIAFDMVQVDSLKWVAFKADFNSSLLFKINFDSLTDNDLDFELVGNFGMLSPTRLKVFGNYVFVTNNGNNTISKIHFDNNFQTVLDSAIITGPFLSPRQMDVVFDCKTNNYFGYVSNVGGTNIVRIDFGNSLANNLPVTTTINTPVGNALGLKMYWQENEWYSFISTTTANFMLLKLGDADNINPQILLDTFPSLLNSTSCIELLVDSSKLHVVNGFSMTHFTYQANCDVSNNWFEGIDSLNYSFLKDSIYQTVEISNLSQDHVLYSFYDSVFVYQSPPVFAFTTNGTCQGEPVQFINQSDICYGSINAWLWDFGDGNQSNVQNPIHLYAFGGTFNVTLTVYTAYGDSGVISKPIKLVPLPTANFFITSNQSCAFNSIVFVDNSMAPGDSIVSWQWTFGDGAGSQQKNTQHVYTNPNNYDLQLLVTNSSGCSDSVQALIEILETPLANFTASGTCINGTVIFNNLTDTSVIAQVSCNWLFGDGNFSPSFDPIHNYLPIDSTYEVKLITKSSNGCSTSFTDSIKIAAPAKVLFTMNKDTVCKDEPVVFINKTTITSNQTLVKSEWYFSDGFTAQNVDTVIHAFAIGGTYSIFLTVTTTTSCDTTFIGTIEVLDNPNVDFVYSNSCYQDSNLFVSAAVAVPGDNLFAYLWNFNDSSAIVNATSVYHQYANPGIYNVMFTVISTKGCIDSIQKNVSVYELPIANFLPAQILCSDSSNQFVDFSYVNSNDTINNWLWNFGDSNTATVQNPTNQYLNAGNYPVQLIIETTKGCRDTVVKLVSVKQSPSPFFSFDSTCFGNYTNFNFINLSPSTGLINEWSWNFGELGTGNSTLENPSHKYVQAATYLVTVTATDTNQCFASFVQPVAIHPLPQAGFTTDYPCEASLTTFTDTSKVNNGIIVQWQWMVNGATMAATNSVNYIFNQSGNYPVQLTVVSNYGCANSIVKPIAIYDLPMASFIVNPLYATPNQLVNFTNTSTNAIQYNWTFGDGFGTNLISPIHAFSDTNNYQIVMIATSDYGCKDTAAMLYSVLVPMLEVAVVDVNYVIKNNQMSLNVQLLNLGNIDITTYDLIARFNETPILVESSIQPITVKSPGIIYYFKSKLVINENFDPEYFCIELVRPNGIIDNPVNNIKCKSIDNSLQLLNIVPNPVVNVLQLYINSPFSQSLNLTVFDMLGRTVLSSTASVKKGFSFVDIDLSFLENGLYNIRLYNGTATLNTVFEKQ